MNAGLDVPVMPQCGLYRTTVELRDPTERLRAGRLVYFHNHSAEGPPVILLPARNANNRWTFHDHGVLIDNLEYLATLIPLKREGYYRLREHFHPNAEQIVRKNALVQLGYNTRAEPILFFPTVHKTDNSLIFPVQGIKVSQPIYDLLEPLDLRGPHAPEVPLLH